jgi:Fe-S oxidoreductase
MAGTFGHEVANQEVSQRLYNMSWQKPVTEAEVVLATGYSCRSQTAANGHSALHPLHYLQQLLEAEQRLS